MDNPSRPSKRILSAQDHAYKDAWRDPAVVAWAAGLSPEERRFAAINGLLKPELPTYAFGPPGMPTLDDCGKVSREDREAMAGFLESQNEERAEVGEEAQTRRSEYVRYAECLHRIANGLQEARNARMEIDAILWACGTGRKITTLAKLRKKHRVGAKRFTALVGDYAGLIGPDNAAICHAAIRRVCLHIASSRNARLEIDSFCAATALSLNQSCSMTMWAARHGISKQAFSIRVGKACKRLKLFKPRGSKSGKSAVSYSLYNVRTRKAHGN